MIQWATIFGTSGGGISLDITVAASLPPTAINDRIVIVTDQPVNDIALDIDQPTSPAIGDVWVSMVDTGSPIYLIDDNKMLIYRPSLTMRYDGTKWVRLDAWQGIDGVWVRISQRITIMGYEWDTNNPSPILTRTDDAVGLTATAGVGAVPGYSDFDNMPIFKDIQRITTASGDVMQRYPKFWYQNTVDGPIWRNRIADGPADGFALFPHTARPDGIRDYMEVGAYHTGAGHVSKPGLAHLASQTRPQFRTGAKGKGTGWGLVDFAAKMAIDTLIRVEYATHDVQTAIGAGITGAAAASNSGFTDSMAYHTGRISGTDDLAAVKWRGLENWWGNTWQFIDGINYNNGAIYICLNPAQYADDTAANYTQLAGHNLATNHNGGYASALGRDAAAPWAQIPVAVGGSASTYLCDALWTSTAWRVVMFGGHFYNGTNAGISLWLYYTLSTYNNPVAGSRLQYLPPAA